MYCGFIQIFYEFVQIFDRFIQIYYGFISGILNDFIAHETVRRVWYNYKGA